MTFTRLPYRWLGSLVLAAVLLAQPAAAQDKDERKEIVIKFADDDPIVIVDGEVLSDEEAQKYLDEHDIDLEGRSFYVGPGDHPYVFRFDGEDDPYSVFGRTAPEVSFFGDFGDRFRTEKLGDQLRSLRGNVAVLDDLGGRLELNLAESMKERSEIARMDMESRRLAMQVREAEGAERDRLEQELEDLLAEIFEKKQALRAERISQLREELAEMEGEQRERETARQEIIERRFRELLGEHDVYGW